MKLQNYNTYIYVEIYYRLNVRHGIYLTDQFDHKYRLTYFFHYKKKGSWEWDKEELHYTPF